MRQILIAVCLFYCLCHACMWDQVAEMKTCLGAEAQRNSSRSLYDCQLECQNTENCLWVIWDPEEPMCYTSIHCPSFVDHQTATAYYLCCPSHYETFSESFFCWATDEARIIQSEIFAWYDYFPLEYMKHRDCQLRCSLDVNCEGFATATIDYSAPVTSMEEFVDAVWILNQQGNDGSIEACVFYHANSYDDYVYVGGPFNFLWSEDIMRNTYEAQYVPFVPDELSLACYRKVLPSCEWNLMLNHYSCQDQWPMYSYTDIESCTFACERQTRCNYVIWDQYGCSFAQFCTQTFQKFKSYVHSLYCSPFHAGFSQTNNTFCYSGVIEAQALKLNHCKTKCEAKKSCVSFSYEKKHSMCYIEVEDGCPMYFEDSRYDMYFRNPTFCWASDGWETTPVNSSAVLPCPEYNLKDSKDFHRFFQYRRCELDGTFSFDLDREECAHSKKEFTTRFDDFERNSNIPWGRQDVTISDRCGSSPASGGKAAIFDGVGYRAMQTLEMNATLGGYIQFEITSGGYCDHSDLREDLVVEYDTAYSGETGTGEWTRLMVIHPTADIISGWVTKASSLPLEAHHKELRIRFRQLTQSGEEYDWWLIDDIFMDFSGRFCMERDGFATTRVGETSTQFCMTHEETNNWWYRHNLTPIHPTPCPTSAPTAAPSPAQRLYECIALHPEDDDTAYDIYVKRMNGWVPPDNWKIVDLNQTNILVNDETYISGARQEDCLYINYTLDNVVIHTITFEPTALPTMVPTRLPTMIPTNVPTPVPTPGPTNMPSHSPWWPTPGPTNNASNASVPTYEATGMPSAPPTLPDPLVMHRECNFDEEFGTVNMTQCGFCTPTGGWPATPLGELANITCPSQEHVYQTRRCMRDGTWAMPENNNCEYDCLVVHVDPDHSASEIEFILTLENGTIVTEGTGGDQRSTFGLLTCYGIRHLDCYILSVSDKYCDGSWWWYIYLNGELLYSNGRDDFDDKCTDTRMVREGTTSFRCEVCHQLQMNEGPEEFVGFYTQQDKTLDGRPWWKLGHLPVTGHEVHLVYDDYVQQWLIYDGHRFIRINSTGMRPPNFEHWTENRDENRPYSTFVPTVVPTMTPTFKPSHLPTLPPTPEGFIPDITTGPPTQAPVRDPSATTTTTVILPTVFPTVAPTQGPTITAVITHFVSFNCFASQLPSTVPTMMPTDVPSVVPTMLPTVIPTFIPTINPTTEPSPAPTFSPTDQPTVMPTHIPTPSPTTAPTDTPTVIPTVMPTNIPTQLPTFKPTVVPTLTPTQLPTVKPTDCPSVVPTFIPTEIPTVVPTVSPTTSPTPSPTGCFALNVTIDSDELWFYVEEEVWEVIDHLWDTQELIWEQINGTSKIRYSKYLYEWVLLYDDDILPLVREGYPPLVNDDHIKSHIKQIYHKIHMTCMSDLPNESAPLPTPKPTSHPTVTPTDNPTSPPTFPPTFTPTILPSMAPHSSSPTTQPTSHPTSEPTTEEWYCWFDFSLTSDKCDVNVTIKSWWNELHFPGLPKGSYHFDIRPVMFQEVMFIPMTFEFVLNVNPFDHQYCMIQDPWVDCHFFNRYFRLDEELEEDMECGSVFSEGTQVWAQDVGLVRDQYGEQSMASTLDLLHHLSAQCVDGVSYIYFDQFYYGGDYVAPLVQWESTIGFKGFITENPTRYVDPTIPLPYDTECYFNITLSEGCEAYIRFRTWLWSKEVHVSGHESINFPNMTDSVEPWEITLEFTSGNLCVVEKTTLNCFERRYQFRWHENTSCYWNTDPLPISRVEYYDVRYPTGTPSVAPTKNPFGGPSGVPTRTPSRRPTAMIPSQTPTEAPVWTPNPTQGPSVIPTFLPSVFPSVGPSWNPSKSPSTFPSTAPTLFPTINGTYMPSIQPNSPYPSITPITSEPSVNPTVSPSNFPSFTSPSCSPSVKPSQSPIIDYQIEDKCIGDEPLFRITAPFAFNSRVTWVTGLQRNNTCAVRFHLLRGNDIPCNIRVTIETSLGKKEWFQDCHDALKKLEDLQDPLMYHFDTIIGFDPDDVVITIELLSTTMPSTSPSRFPSTNPTTCPSTFPSKKPSVTPTDIPSTGPSRTPSKFPSTPGPSTSPTLVPVQTRPVSIQELRRPTHAPTKKPTSSPTTEPSEAPSYGPSVIPTGLPSHGPTVCPTYRPTRSPSQMPTVFPTKEPTEGWQSWFLINPEITCPTQEFQLRSDIHFRNTLGCDSPLDESIWNIVGIAEDMYGNNVGREGLGERCLSSQHRGLFWDVDAGFLKATWTLPFASVPDPEVQIEPFHGPCHLAIEDAWEDWAAQTTLSPKPTSLPPTPSPTETPTFVPTILPTLVPTLYPTESPTPAPTRDTRCIWFTSQDTPALVPDGKVFTSQIQINFHAMTCGELRIFMEHKSVSDINIQLRHVNSPFQMTLKEKLEDMPVNQRVTFDIPRLEANGTWRLVILDEVFGDSGWLYNWSMWIRPYSIDFTKPELSDNTLLPTKIPTPSPTLVPTIEPTDMPTEVPTTSPTTSPIDDFCFTIYSDPINVTISDHQLVSDYLTVTSDVVTCDYFFLKMDHDRPGDLSVFIYLDGREITSVQSDNLLYNYGNEYVYRLPMDILATGFWSLEIWDTVQSGGYGRIYQWGMSVKNDTAEPTMVPTFLPTFQPTTEPTESPTYVPTESPITERPTEPETCKEFFISGSTLFEGYYDVQITRKNGYFWWIKRTNYPWEVYMDEDGRWYLEQGLYRYWIPHDDLHFDRPPAAGFWEYSVFPGRPPQTLQILFECTKERRYLEFLDVNSNSLDDSSEENEAIYISEDSVYHERRGLHDPELEWHDFENNSDYPDPYVPQCDDIGFFKREQCYAENATCFCVDQLYGEIEPGTRTDGYIVCRPLNLCAADYVERMMGLQLIEFAMEHDYPFYIPKNFTATPTVAPTRECRDVIMEAENAELTEVKVRNYHQNFTGRGYVDFENKQSNVRFTIDARKGWVSLWFTYAGGSTRHVEFFMNGKFISSLRLMPTGGWDKWVEYDLGELWFKDGINTFDFRGHRDGYNGPNIDHLHYIQFCDEFGKGTRKKWGRRQLHSDSEIHSIIDKLYIPQCDEDGFYQPRQCDQFGFCWCVEPETGEQLTATFTEGLANCYLEVGEACDNIWRCGPGLFCHEDYAVCIQEDSFECILVEVIGGPFPGWYFQNGTVAKKPLWKALGTDHEAEIFFWERFDMWAMQGPGYLLFQNTTTRQPIRHHVWVVIQHIDNEERKTNITLEVICSSSERPTHFPTTTPTTSYPSVTPTEIPTVVPTLDPTPLPTYEPTRGCAELQISAAETLIYRIGDTWWYVESMHYPHAKGWMNTSVGANFDSLMQKQYDLYQDRPWFMSEDIVLYWDGYWHRWVITNNRNQIVANEALYSSNGTVVTKRRVLTTHEDHHYLQNGADDEVIRTNNAIYSKKLSDDDILNFAIAEWEHGIIDVFPLIEVICFAGDPTFSPTPAPSTSRPSVTPTPQPVTPPSPQPTTSPTSSPTVSPTGFCMLLVIQGFSEFDGTYALQPSLQNRKQHWKNLNTTDELYYSDQFDTWAFFGESGTMISRNSDGTQPRTNGEWEFYEGSRFDKLPQVFVNLEISCYETDEPSRRPTPQPTEYPTLTPTESPTYTTIVDLQTQNKMIEIWSIWLPPFLGLACLAAFCARKMSVQKVEEEIKEYHKIRRDILDGSSEASTSHLSDIYEEPKEQWTTESEDDDSHTSHLAYGLYDGVTTTTSKETKQAIMTLLGGGKIAPIEEYMNQTHRTTQVHFTFVLHRVPSGPFPSMVFTGCLWEVLEDAGVPREKIEVGHAETTHTVGEEDNVDVEVIIEISDPERLVNLIMANGFKEIFNTILVTKKNFQNTKVNYVELITNMQKANLEIERGQDLAIRKQRVRDLKTVFVAFNFTKNGFLSFKEFGEWTRRFLEETSENILTWHKYEQLCSGYGAMKHKGLTFEMFHRYANTLEIDVDAQLASVTENPPIEPYGPRYWKTPDVCNWLYHLEEGKYYHYVPIFERMGVTGAELLQMDRADLRDKVGVQNAGHRNAIMRAITDLEVLIDSGANEFVGLLESVLPISDEEPDADAIPESKVRLEKTIHDISALLDRDSSSEAESSSEPEDDVSDFLDLYEDNSSTKTGGSRIPLDVKLQSMPLEFDTATLTGTMSDVPSIPDQHDPESIPLTVKRLFKALDKNKNHYIGYAEFMEYLVICNPDASVDELKMFSESFLMTLVKELGGMPDLGFSLREFAIFMKDFERDAEQDLERLGGAKAEEDEVIGLFDSAFKVEEALPENPLFWNTDGVKNWLESVDNGRFACYVDAIYEHMITGIQLVELSRKDLEADLGVQNPNHQDRLLEEIQKFRTNLLVWRRQVREKFAEDMRQAREAAQQKLKSEEAKINAMENLHKAMQMNIDGPRMPLEDMSFEELKAHFLQLGIEMSDHDIEREMKRAEIRADFRKQGVELSSRSLSVELEKVFKRIVLTPEEKALRAEFAALGIKMGDREIREEMEKREKLPKKDQVEKELRKHFEDLGFDMSDDEIEEHVEAKMFTDRLEAMGLELDETRIREEFEKEKELKRKQEEPSESVSEAESEKLSKFQEDWTPRHVLIWITRLDGGAYYEYFEEFDYHKVTGKQLLCMTDERLMTQFHVILPSHRKALMEHIRSLEQYGQFDEGKEWGDLEEIVEEDSEARYWNEISETSSMSSGMYAAKMRKINMISRRSAGRSIALSRKGSVSSSRSPAHSRRSGSVYGRQSVSGRSGSRRHRASAFIRSRSRYADKFSEVHRDLYRSKSGRHLLRQSSLKRISVSSETPIDSEDSETVPLSSASASPSPFLDSKSQASSLDYTPDIPEVGSPKAVNTIDEESSPTMRSETLSASPEPEVKLEISERPKPDRFTKPPELRGKTISASPGPSLGSRTIATQSVRSLATADVAYSQTPEMQSRAYTTSMAVSNANLDETSEGDISRAWSKSSSTDDEDNLEKNVEEVIDQMRKELEDVEELEVEPVGTMVKVEADLSADIVTKEVEELEIEKKEEDEDETSSSSSLVGDEKSESDVNDTSSSDPRGWWNFESESSSNDDEEMSTESQERRSQSNRVIKHRRETTVMQTERLVHEFIDSFMQPALSESEDINKSESEDTGSSELLEKETESNQNQIVHNMKEILLESESEDIKIPPITGFNENSELEDKTELGKPSSSENEDKPRTSFMSWSDASSHITETSDSEVLAIDPLLWEGRPPDMTFDENRDDPIHMLVRRAELQRKMLEQEAQIDEDPFTVSHTTAEEKTEEEPEILRKLPEYVTLDWRRSSVHGDTSSINTMSDTEIESDEMKADEVKKFDLGEEDIESEETMIEVESYQSVTPEPSLEDAGKAQIDSDERPNPQSKIVTIDTHQRDFSEETLAKMMEARTRPRRDKAGTLDDSIFNLVEPKRESQISLDGEFFDDNRVRMQRDSATTLDDTFFSDEQMKVRLESESETNLDKDFFEEQVQVKKDSSVNLDEGFFNVPVKAHKRAGTDLDESFFDDSVLPSNVVEEDTVVGVGYSRSISQSFLESRSSFGSIHGSRLESTPEHSVLDSLLKMEDVEHSVQNVDENLEDDETETEDDGRDIPDTSSVPMTLSVDLNGRRHHHADLDSIAGTDPNSLQVLARNRNHHADLDSLARSDLQSVTITEDWRNNNPFPDEDFGTNV